ncbi:MAG: cold shock domain-containing protein, partial [Gammaproteobacteria bacterium]|nr:cold shock domain-containing protein [Gammaproteobacteria bacterium]
MKSVNEHKSTPENNFLNAPTSLGPNPPVDRVRQGKVKWYDPSILRYGFIVMEGRSKDVFFHVNDVHSAVKFTLKEGDEVTFIFNEYGKRGTDVQRLSSFL